jgi:hypothetical protein
VTASLGNILSFHLARGPMPPASQLITQIEQLKDSWDHNKIVKIFTFTGTVPKSYSQRKWGIYIWISIQIRPKNNKEMGAENKKFVF